MAKRRKRQQANEFSIKKGRKERIHLAPSDPKERYEWAIANGHELNSLLSANLSGNTQDKSLRELFPNSSVGYSLLSGGAKRLKEIYDYYSRGDIQKAMFEYAAGRQITFLRLFKPQYDRLVKSVDILPLSLCILLANGDYWPSLHGTVSKYSPGGKQLCDAVIELDYKSSWKKCFEMTKPVVDMLRDNGAVFKLKYSGHCSVHIIIPGEVLQFQGIPVDHSMFYRCLSELVKGRVKEPRCLDTSFHMPHHFLRLAYSVNENTGLVSLPFDPGDYDHFDPSQAHPRSVKPLQGWWSVPRDGPKRMEEFIRSVMRGKIALSSRGVVVVPEIPSDGWQVSQKLVKQARQRKRQAMREFLPNEGFYDRMVRLGQDVIDLREFLLLEDEASKAALRAVKHLHNMGQQFHLSSIAGKFGVDETDLEMLWNWEQKERVFRYYARDEIKQAVFELAQRRKVRVGNEDRLVFLQEPADLTPLLVYASLISENARDRYPAIYFTNSCYERTGEIPITCDLKIEFGAKSEEESILEAAMPALSLLTGFDVTYFMFFDGVRGLSVMIPYEAFPDKAKLAQIGHANTEARLSPHLKRSMRMPGATCTLVRDPHALSIMPYSIHPQTGLACIPMQFSDLLSFSERDAWLGSVQVDNEWWNIPENASEVTANFLKQMAPVV